MEITSTISLAVVGALFIARIPSALRNPSSRLTWVASGFGFAALLSLGFIIPLRIVDRITGGENNWALATAVTSTCAFWCMMKAVERVGNIESPRITFLFPAAVIAVFTCLFFMISHREGTSQDFVVERISQTACWLCITVFITGLLVIAWTSFNIVRPMRGFPYRLFQAGYALVVAGTTEDDVFMALSHFSSGDRHFRELFWDTFTALFYLGVIAIALGFLTKYADSVNKLSMPIWRIRSLQLMRILNRFEPSTSLHKAALIAFFALDPIAETLKYDIRLRNLEDFEGAVLNRRETSVIRRAEKALSRRLDQKSSLPMPATETTPQYLETP